MVLTEAPLRCEYPVNGVDVLASCPRISLRSEDSAMK